MNDSGDRPTIVVVDDNPRLKGGWAVVADQCDVLPVGPDELRPDLLNQASLVVVDFVLDDWVRGRSDLTRPRDGLGLVGVLRSHAGALDAMPRAFALMTGDPDLLPGGDPGESREHVLARLNNLEWLFRSTELDTVPRLEAIALAVQSLPPVWPRQEIKERVLSILRLDESAAWKNAAWETITDALPPIHTLSEWSHGIAFLRWLLHRVLPYSTFLADEYQLAARLSVSVESLRAARSEDSELSRELHSRQFAGILADFLGPRWWRAGVDQLVWDLAGGSAHTRDDTKAALERVEGSEGLRFLDFSDAVRPLGVGLVPEDTLVSATECVRLQPDDWPAFAGRAWARIDAVRDADPTELRPLVVEDDAPRLEEDHP